MTPMQPVENSDGVWLIVCDWLQDRDVVYAEEMRESILGHLRPRSWEYQYRFSVGVGVGGGSVGVGSEVER